MKYFLLLLAFIVGCSSDPTATIGTITSPVVVVENKDARFSVKPNTWVQVRLRVYPPNSWRFIGKTGADGIRFDDSVQKGTSGPIRVTGAVPGDAEYDVFNIHIVKSGEYVFYLVKDNQLDQRFSFHVIALR